VRGPIIIFKPEGNLVENTSEGEGKESELTLKIAGKEISSFLFERKRGRRNKKKEKSLLRTKGGKKKEMLVVQSLYLRKRWSILDGQTFFEVKGAHKMNEMRDKIIRRREILASTGDSSNFVS